LKFIGSACAGQRRGGNAKTLVSRVCTDSRQVQAGDLFFALAGGRFDGHDFLPEVTRKGTAAAVVNRDKVPADLPRCAVIAVDDPRQALGRLAARYRTTSICRSSPWAVPTGRRR